MHMGTSIAQGSKKKLVDQCYDDPDTRPIMLRKMEAFWELMYSEKTASILRSNTYDDYQKFSWGKLIQEMRVHAPVLTNILFSCTATKNPGPNRMAIIGLCCSNNLLQKVILLILHAGHCGKHVRRTNYIFPFVKSNLTLIIMKKPLLPTEDAI